MDKRTPMALAISLLSLGAAANAYGAESANTIDLGGKLVVDYVYIDDDNTDLGSERINADKRGDFLFTYFGITADGAMDEILFSAEYRFYSYQDFLKHGWFGYQHNEALRTEVGVTQVPFGILPYADHSWWFGLHYYIGLEDDYDAGIKVSYDQDPWSVQFAFFKNDEFGDATDSERYSTDLFDDGGASPFAETNQVNLRAAFKMPHGNTNSTEFGVSGEWGQMYNSTTRDEGDHWAVGLHVFGQYGPFDVMLQAARQEFDPDIDVTSVTVSQFSSTYDIASEPDLYVANVAVDIPVNIWKINEVTCYNDFSTVRGGNTVDDSKINITGCSAGLGPIYTYMEVMVSKNAVFLENDSIAGDIGLADANDDWDVRFQWNIGYYF